MPMPRSPALTSRTFSQVPEAWRERSRRWGLLAGSGTYALDPKVTFVMQRCVPA